MANLNEVIGRSQPFVKVLPPPIVGQRAPTTTDTGYPKGQQWIDESVSPSVIYAHVGGGDWDAGGNQAASTTVAGTIRIATDAEASAATSTDTAMTPYTAGLIARIDTVTITTAQVLALATTPIELVAAPGADKFIEFLGAQFILDYNSIGYTESGDNLGIKYTDASGVQVSSTVECTGFIDQTADTITSAVPVSDAIVAASASVNKALVLDNLNANFAAGNSPLKVIISYRVITAGL